VINKEDGKVLVSVSILMYICLCLGMSR